MAGFFRSQPVVPGDRVVVRRRIPAEPGHVTDVIGHVVSLDPLTVRPQKVGGLPSAAEALVIPDELIQVVRRLSPRRVRNSDIRNLEVATAAAFPGVEHRWSADGQWLLRAGDGITERSNSAVPLGHSAGFSAVPLAEIREFYAAHGLPPVIAIPERIGAAGEKLVAAHPDLWRLGPEILVLARSLADTSDAAALADAPEGMTVRVDEQPDDAWLSLYHFRGRPLPPAALELLRTQIDGTMGFGRLCDAHGSTIAITRGTVTRDAAGNAWLGYSAVEVAEGWRRRGLGTVLGAHMIRWGAAAGATGAYLQVVESNAAGRALYQRLGFVEHHRHRYAHPVSPGPRSTAAPMG